MTSKIDRRTFLGGAAALGARMLAAEQPFEDTTSWDPFVPNIAAEATYLRRKFRQDVTDKATGLDIAGLKKLLRVMLHPSAVQGQKGLEVMKALVRQYHANGGCVVHFNVFSAEELRDAQAHPEKYENLQVRVCGWNVRWNDLDKIEQDKYVARAENVR